MTVGFAGTESHGEDRRALGVADANHLSFVIRAYEDLGSDWESSRKSRAAAVLLSILSPPPPPLVSIPEESCDLALGNSRKLWEPRATAREEADLTATGRACW